MSKLPDPKLLELKFELIHKELDDTQPLFSLLSVRSPGSIEIRAAGSIMQSVYNGLEVVFSLCVDTNGSSELNWHRMLLEKAAGILGFADDLQLRLEMLQKFRHKYRHAHGYMLD